MNNYCYKKFFITVFSLFIANNIVSMDSIRSVPMYYPASCLSKQKEGQVFLAEDDIIAICFNKKEEEDNIYKAFQMIPAEYDKKEQRYSNIKNAGRLDKREWRYIFRSHFIFNGLAVVELKVPEIDKYPQRYEIWGKGNDNLTPDFLCYMTVKKSPNSLDDFLEQNETFEIEDLRQRLMKAIQEEQQWTKKLYLKLNNIKKEVPCEIVTLLGKGDDGTVLLVKTNEKDYPLVAVKLWKLNDKKILGRIQKKQIELEIKARKLFIKKYISKLYNEESFEFSGMIGIAMEYIPGKTIHDFLEKTILIDFDIAEKMIKIILEICSSIKLTDFTSANILIPDKYSSDVPLLFIDFARWEEGGNSFTDTKIKKILQKVMISIIERVESIENKELLKNLIDKEVK